MLEHDGGKVAAVYTVRPGESNEELRYSLRSLKNTPWVSDVYIVGHKPAWLTNVNHIDMPARGNKYETTTVNLIEALPELPEHVTLWNDDMFATKRINRLPNYHRGTVDEVIAEFTARGIHSRYVAGMRETKQALQRIGHDNPLSYELHIPMFVNTEAYADALTWGRRAGIRVLHKRTAYGVINNIGGQRTQDVKMRTMDAQPPTGPWLSSMDTVFQYGAGNIVKWLFPNPGRHEA
jgi:hypothetical protein